jgi:hypothetical protein
MTTTTTTTCCAGCGFDIPPGAGVYILRFRTWRTRYIWHYHAGAAYCRGRALSLWDRGCQGHALSVAASYDPAVHHADYTPLDAPPSTLPDTSPRPKEHAHGRV